MTPAAKTRKNADLGSALESHRLTDVYERFSGDDDLHRMLVAVGLVQGYKLVSQRLESVLAPLDLYLSLYEVLGMLEIAGGRMSLRDLKRASLVHPATMTHTIDSLRKRGLITREPILDDGKDRRVIVAEITAQGRRLYVKATEAMRGIGFGIPELPVDDANQLAVLLSRLT